MTTKTAIWGADNTQTKSPILSTVQAVIAAALRAHARRRTYSALADLDDHMLSDIGLNPSEVRPRQHSMADWIVQTQSGTARLVFIGR